jgi:hypothetical protein
MTGTDDIDAEDPSHINGRYDRAYLLSPAKRNQALELWEVRRYGRDTFSDPDYTRLYGMEPMEWYRRGIRLLARTTVECVRDALGDLIGQDVAGALEQAPSAASFTVIDPFAGSCNSLYWILRHLPDAHGLAFEMDPTIFAMTHANLACLEVMPPIDLRCGDYQALLPICPVPPNHFLIVFVSPPWGDALNLQTGLNLQRTQPPIPEILETIERVHRDRPILYIIQVRQPIDITSLAELASQFEWSQLRIYDINAEGMKPGILLGSHQWRPNIPNVW